MAAPTSSRRHSGFLSSGFNAAYYLRGEPPPALLLHSYFFLHASGLGQDKSEGVIDRSRSLNRSAAGLVQLSGFNFCAMTVAGPPLSRIRNSWGFPVGWQRHGFSTHAGSAASVDKSGWQKRQSQEDGRAARLATAL